MAMIENYMKDIDRSFLNGEDETIFLAVKKSKLVLEKYQQQMKEIQQSPKTINIEFEPNKQVEKFFLNLKDLGTVKTSGEPVPEAEIQLPVINKNMERRMSVANLRTDRSLELPLGVKMDKHRGSLPMLDTTGISKAQLARSKTRRPDFIGKIFACVVLR